jgi:hypothetical protein
VLPQLRELEHEFADALVVIGVHSAKFPAERILANVRKAVARNEVEHAVVNDPDHLIWESYAVRAWPTLMFVNPQGRVIGKHEGEFPLATMRSILREMIDAFDAAGQLERGLVRLRPETEANGALRFPGKVLATERWIAIADSGHHQVLLATHDGEVTHRLGSGERGLVDGAAEGARFTQPQGLAFSPDHTTLFVADTGNHALRAIDLASGEVRTVAGTGARGQSDGGGRGSETDLASPWDLNWLDGELWIANAGTHQIWAFDPATGLMREAAGTGHESIHDGPLAEATFAQPSGLSALNGVVYVADSETSAVRQVEPGANRVRRLVGRGLFTFGDVDARADSVRLQHPLGVAAVEERGQPAVYIADSYNNKIKRLDPLTRQVETVVGTGDHGHTDGDFADAELWEPGGLSVFGRRMYIADTNNHAVRIADLESRTIATLELRP